MVSIKSLTNSVQLLESTSQTQFNFSIHGAELHVICQALGKNIITNYRQGKAMFSIFEYKEIVFFLSKFGDEGWMDAPFHAAMNPEEFAGTPTEFVAGQHHLSLAIELSDIDSDVTYGARLVTISKEMSSHLVKIAETQLTNPISRQEYEARIEQAYAQYTASQMARRATIRSRGGASEDVVNNKSGSKERSIKFPEFIQMENLQAARNPIAMINVAKLAEVSVDQVHQVTAADVLKFCASKIDAVILEVVTQDPAIFWRVGERYFYDDPYFGEVVDLYDLRYNRTLGLHSIHW